MTEAPEIDVEPLGEVARCAVVGASRGGTRNVVPLGRTADTPYRIASLTKSVTAVATVLALEKAGLTIDTPAIDLLPDLRNTWKADKHLTVAHIRKLSTSCQAPSAVLNSEAAS